MAVGCLEPLPPHTPSGNERPVGADGVQPGKPWIDLGIRYAQYPLVYAIKIALALAAIAFVWPGYREYTWRGNWSLAIAVGIGGAAAWIALAAVQRYFAQQTDISWLKSLGERSAFNPLDQLKHNSALAYGFLAVRFFGLVAVVPLIEEFFLRGFLMRFVMRERWWEVPFGTVNKTAIVAGTLIPVLMHPQEVLAAAVWFSAVTWLMIRTRSIWSCILAHAVTNLLLGCYVVFSGNWWLM